MGAVLYGRQGCPECTAARDVLDHLGVSYEVRLLDSDRQALREWQALDGVFEPLVVFEGGEIVRGLDAPRLEQAVGWSGC